MRVGERDTIISGIGQSAVGRRLGRSSIDLTMEASLAAIEDAGLTAADIDGISCYPGGMMDSFEPGFGGPGTPDVQDALRLNLRWHSGGPEGPGQITAVFNACAAVAAGLARHVLVYRTVWESTAQGQGGRKGVGGGQHARIDGNHQWFLPFGAISAAHWLAMNAQRHFHEYGTTRAQLGQIAVNGRRNAALNPKAIYTDPMSLDDYLAARTITTPLCLFDCDIPADGSTAFVVSHRDFAPDVRNVPIHVNAIGTALEGRPSWDQRPDMTVSVMKGAADSMWNRTELTPSDVDTAQLYDGFSIIALLNLEALGFCGIGEAGAFLEGGKRIALEGELPINTNGGQLSAGRLHGFGFLHEACTQLRGEGGARQVAGAPEVAAVANGGGPIAGTMLVTRGVR
jgi:acetyl-CoA acetyltransferase